MLSPDVWVGVQGVAVAVECRECHTSGLEEAEVLIAGVLAGPDIRHWQVDGGQETTGVDLRAVQAKVADGPHGLGDGFVMQNGGIDAKLHCGRPFVSR